MNNKIILPALVIAILLVTVVVIAYSKKGAPVAPTYDALAQCLTDSGVKFYGAFWCPHCQNQKKEFGGAAKLLPYIECSNPDGQGQTQVCTDAGITGYPTWEFANGERVSGEIPLEKLAEKSGCAMPGGSTVPTTATETPAAQPLTAMPILNATPTPSEATSAAQVPTTF
jgi:hypothetical protein